MDAVGSAAEEFTRLNRLWHKEHEAARVAVERANEYRAQMDAVWDRMERAKVDAGWPVPAND